MVHQRNIASAVVVACLFVIIPLWIAGCAPARHTTGQAEIQPAEIRGFLVAGYHPWWMQDTWRTYDFDVFDEIYYFSIDLDSTGAIADRNGWPDRWFTMQQDLVRRGVTVSPVVTLFSRQGFERIFSSEVGSGELTSTLIGLLEDSPAVGGLQLDFEIYQPVSSTARGRFTEFVASLRERMQAVRPGSRLSMYMLAYDEADVFDEAALAGYVDYFVVQGYDLHGRNEDRTGPIAGLSGWGNRNWKFVVQRFMDLGVPSDRIVMSVPYFGYEWPAASDEPGARTTGAGLTLGYAPIAPELLPGTRRSIEDETLRYEVRRDSLSGSPYYAYEDSSGWRQVWFEDAQSLAAKYAFVREAGLRGVAIFPPAYGSEDMSSVLREAFTGRMP